MARKKVLLLLCLGGGESKDRFWGREPTFPFVKCQSYMLVNWRKPAGFISSYTVSLH